MRLGWTDHFSCRAPDASRTSSASRGPFYFAWGCFRDFVSGLPRCTAEEAQRCVRDTRSFVLRAHGESIQLQCIMLQRHPVRGYCRTAFAVSTNRALVVAVASTVPSSAVSFPATKAMVLPSCVTSASPVIGPGFAGARKLTVMVMVAV